MDEQKTIALIKKVLYQEYGKRVGDTPTESLQLVNKKYVDELVVYTGVIGSNGVPSKPFPTGWTSSQLGAGDYVVTHTLKTSVYSLVSTSTAPTTTITSQGNPTFEIQTLNSAGSNTNAIVNFIVSKR